MKTFAIALLLAGVAYAKKANRIFDGEDATPHEFPYEVSLQYRDPNTTLYKHFCGGTILNNSYVLTAAHCKPQEEILATVKVIAGAHDFSNKTGFLQTSNVSSFVTHEAYTGGPTANDIGIIKLKTPFKFNDKVKAATLAKKGYIATGNATTAGWGYINDDYDRPEVLQKAVLELYNDKKCHELWYGERYADSNVCGGQVPGLRSVCKGDSGSPLIQKDGNSTIVVGVTSWSHFRCGIKPKPSVFVEVVHYLDWIKKNMK